MFAGVGVAAVGLLGASPAAGKQVRLEIGTEGGGIDTPLFTKITAYCPCVKCCGKWASVPPVTASGARPKHRRTVAADTDLFPFGTVLQVPGVGRVTVEDRGSAVKGFHLDLYHDDHDAAKDFGVRHAYVRVIKEVKR